VTSRLRATLTAFAVLALLAGCAASGSTGSPSPSTLKIIAVPADAPTIQSAINRIAPGGLVLVSPGTYREEVTISTKNVTLRGLDRNTVIIDGQGLRANGIQVIADGVRIQNLTVTDDTFNGVLITGLHDASGPQAHNLTGYTKLDPKKFPPLQRFEVDHVTATNNGLYGIYAFNSQNGALTNNYTSGSADSGFYVGQCRMCNILVSGNVAERNAIGYENANASDSVIITGNRFSGNRVGLTLLSWYQESFVPQHGATVAGNVISDNNSSDSPAQAQGGFGIGVGLSGAQGDLFARNLIAGNSVSGIQMTNTEDIPTIDTKLEGNSFSGNGLDVADRAASRAPTTGTCVTPANGLTVLTAVVVGTCDPGATVSTQALPSITAPPGMSFRRVAQPKKQSEWSGDLRAVPGPLPAVGAAAKFELASVTMPAATLLADLTGTR